MKVLVSSLCAGLLLTGGSTLATKYSTERALKFEISTSNRMETTTMEMEVDGEPQDTGGRGGASTESENTEIHVDHVMEVSDGKPTKVRRTFEKVGGTASMSFGDQSRDSSVESPFQGVTLELVAGKDGAVETTVVDGKEPESEGALKGHHLETFLDGLLPASAVEVDATWDLEKDAISRALRLDVRKALYPRPQRGGGGGEGGGGDRPRRGGGGGRGNSVLDTAEWKGTAKLVSADKEIEGVSCSVIELKLEATGDMEMPEMRGPRGGVYAPEAALENRMNYSIKLEGTFAFANKEKRPVKLDLEGKMRTETRTEMTREDRTMKMHSVQEGKIEYAITCTEESTKAEKKDSK